MNSFLKDICLPVKGGQAGSDGDMRKMKNCYETVTNH